MADAAMTVSALEDTPTALCGVGEPAMPESTDKDNYLRNVAQLISELRQRGGKTVISRVVCGHVQGMEWLDFAKYYF